VRTVDCPEGPQIRLLLNRELAQFKGTKHSVISNCALEGKVFSWHH
jgi:hypothetical protein